MGFNSLTSSSKVDGFDGFTLNSSASMFSIVCFRFLSWFSCFDWFARLCIPLLAVKCLRPLFPRLSLVVWNLFCGGIGLWCYQVAVVGDCSTRVVAAEV